MGENHLRTVLQEVTHRSHLGVSLDYCKEKYRCAIATLLRTISRGEQVMMSNGSGIRLHDLIATLVARIERRIEAVRVPFVLCGFAVHDWTIAQKRIV